MNKALVNCILDFLFAFFLLSFSLSSILFFVSFRFVLHTLHYRRSVLEQHRSNGLDYMGPIKPSLALCVFSVFVLVYFSLWKGVRSAGKVVWVTALAPYVVLLFLLVRGITLPGAGEGIRYYLTPEWHKLKNSKVCLKSREHFMQFSSFYVPFLCRCGSTQRHKYFSH